MISGARSGRWLIGLGWTVLLVGIFQGPLAANAALGAAATDMAGKNMVFAMGYESTNASGSGMYQMLGYYHFDQSGGGEIAYLFYEGNADNKPWATPYRQPPDATFVPGLPCNPGPIYIPGYNQFVRLPITWSVSGGVLKVRIGDVVHEWTPDTSAAGGWTLAGPFLSALDGKNTVAGMTFSNTVGFAYETQDLVSAPIGLKDLKNFSGEVYSNESGSGGWQHSLSGLTSSVFTAADNNTAYYRTPCPYSGSPANMFCQSTLLFDYAPLSNLIVYNNVSHAFNSAVNGCLDVTGHTKQMWAVTQNGVITGFVVVQYSWQSSQLNNIPILEVGRYY